MENEELHLGMFAPCDEQGYILEEPMYDPSNEQYWSSAFFQFEKVNQNILFDSKVTEYKHAFEIQTACFTIYHCKTTKLFYDVDGFYQTLNDLPKCT